MKSGMLVPWLVPLFAACAGPARQADSTGQPQKVVVRDYDAESITGSHLKRRGGVSAMEGQTLSPAALEEWQRLRPNPKGMGNGG